MSDYYYYNNINKKVDFKFSTREAFLELQKVKEDKNVYPSVSIFDSSKVYFYMVDKNVKMFIILRIMMKSSQFNKMMSF